MKQYEVSAHQPLVDNLTRLIEKNINQALAAH
jgi:hypothetical protein